MEISELSSTTPRTPLLENVVDGSMDFQGRPVFRSSSGGWRASSFIIGVEVAEKFADFGIICNLITFLTGPLGQSVATAAGNVNVWFGTATLMPLLGAFVADSFLGRYRTILFSSMFFILGLGLLTLSALLQSNTIDCKNTNDSTSCSSRFQVIFFFFALYLVAIAQGGHRPCVQAFGADQFDEDDPEECKAKSSFFNWWYFFTSILFGATCWTVWLQRNSIIFDNKQPDWQNIFYLTLHRAAVWMNAVQSNFLYSSQDLQATHGGSLIWTRKRK